jgi:hypothetical protein
MRLLKGLASVMVVLLVVGMLVPAVSAERDSLVVAVITEDRIYEPGDTIEIEIQVYDRGTLTDADEIECTLDTRWQGDDIDVALTQVSTGTYEGSYVIQENDYHAYFEVYAVRDTDSDYAELSIEIYDGSFEMDINFAHQSCAYAWPGDVVTATLMTTYRGSLVDVDRFDYVRLYTPEDTEIELTQERIGTGTYRSSWTVPQVTENGVYEMQARAYYANAHATASSRITVNLYTVWYNLDTMASGTATFTLGVSDHEGKAVSNAVITIEEPQERTGTTNSEGIVIFSLSNVWDGIRVEGYAKVGEKIQTFEGNIYEPDSSETETPAHHEFDVIYTGEDYIYDAGSSISRSYKAYNCTVPMQDWIIYYYIALQGMDMVINDGLIIPSTGHHVDGVSDPIKVGSVTTNQLGDFTISFKAPSDQGLIYIYFEAGIPRHPYNYNQWGESEYDEDDGLVYEEDVDALFIIKGDLTDSDKIEIESEPLTVGGTTKVTVRPSDNLENGDRLFAKLMPGRPTNTLYVDEGENEWACWVEGGDCIFLTENGHANEFEGEAVIPEFMSKDGDYTIVAGNIDSDDGYPYVSHATLKEGESAGDEAMDPMMVLLLVGLVVLVLLMLLGASIMNKGSDDSKLPGETQEHQTSPDMPGQGPYAPPAEPAPPQGNPPPDDYMPQHQADSSPPEDYLPPPPQD